MISPRHTTHAGSVSAAGFWLTGCEPHDLRARALALWESGASVRSVPGGLVITLRRERRVSAIHGRAAPLVLQAGKLLAAPLRAAELATLGPASSLVLVEGGTLRAFELDQLPAEDPASWLDVSAFELKEPQTLGQAGEPAAALTAPENVAALFDERVGRTPQETERQAQLIGALEGLRGGRDEAARVGGKPWRALTRAFFGALARLASWLSTRAARRSGASPSLPPAQRGAAPGPSWWQRLKDALANVVARSPLMAQLGRQQAQYLQQLFELLESHDDQEVLRRAIPLGKGETGPGRPALLPPTPRTSLGISLGRQAPGSSMVLVDHLFAALRRSYEAVFERLDAAGRHEDAAYFLAEILGEAERAVAYLERHDQLELAAKLAEARELPAALVVRQWFLAGQRQRAITIAVREGAFDDAVLRLERAGQKEEAGALRLLQAERLAQAGCYLKAAELAYRSHATALALRWLALARDAGDLRGVPLELSLDSQRFDAAHAALLPLWSRHLPDELPVKLHVADAFVNLNVVLGRPLARELSRELFAEAAQSGSESVARCASRVANWVGGAFKADLPPLVSFARKRAEPARLRNYQYEPHDAGQRPIFDVHALGARFLVALGEAGVVLLNRRGERVAHFELPAEELVTSLDGSRVLCVARRGDALQVGRIELATQRSERWCELKADTFARSFDGESWLVARSGWPHAHEGELLLLDVLDDRPTVLRRVPMPLDPSSIHFEAGWCNVVGTEPFSSIERMQFDLPRLTLRKRQQLVDFRPDSPPRAAPGTNRYFSGAAGARANDAAVVYERWVMEGVAEPHAPCLVRGDQRLELPSHDAGHASLVVDDNRYALSIFGEARCRVFVGSFAASGVQLDLTLHGAAKARVRLLPQAVVVCDSAGRLLAFDPKTGSPLVELRL